MRRIIVAVLALSFLISGACQSVPTNMPPEVAVEDTAIPVSTETEEVTVNEAPPTETETPEVLGENMMLNSDFSEGMEPWQIFTYGGSTASADAVVEDGMLTLTIHDPGSIHWHVQVVQEDIPLETGKTYKVTLELSASKERSIDVVMSRNGGPGGTDYAYYGSTTLNLTTELAEYSFTFQMNEPSDEISRFVIEAGEQAGDLHIKRVTIQPVE